MGYAGRIHEHGYPINHRFRMVSSSLFELHVPAPSWLVPCMQFDEEQKRANRKWEGDCYSYTYAVWCWLVYFKGLWSAIYASVYINSTRNWGLYWKKERANSKPKAWCCSTIHDAHGRHGQQCHDAVFRVYRGKAMKIVPQCVLPSICPFLFWFQKNIRIDWTACLFGARLRFCFPSIHRSQHVCR